MLATIVIFVSAIGFVVWLVATKRQSITQAVAAIRHYRTRSQAMEAGTHARALTTAGAENLLQVRPQQTAPGLPSQAIVELVPMTGTLALGETTTSPASPAQAATTVEQERDAHFHW